MNTSWLRLVLALLTFAGTLALGGCGGGSGAPNNPYAPVPPAPGPLFVLPTALTVYPHTPATLTVSGGTTPYAAFSSNASIMPVASAVSGGTIVLLANDVATDTVTIITVQDAVGKTATATVTVRPAPLFNTLTITPSRTACGTNTVCSGDTATASVIVTGLGGAGIPNRTVKFDVVSGAFAIQTSNPAQPLAATLNAVSDSTGKAQVILQAAVNAPTQSAVLRATELQSGNTVSGTFTIVQQTDGSAILSVVPPTATISGADTASCSGNFRVDYFIYGGTPPYRISSTFPSAVTLVNSVVNVVGGSFSAITNGTCVNPLVFTIVDATGRQTTAQLLNIPGTAAPPMPPPPPVITALTITPASQAIIVGPLNCPGKTFAVLVTGGTPAYNVFLGPPGMVTNPSSGVYNVTITAAGTTTVNVIDSGSPQQAKSATISCS